MKKGRRATQTSHSNSTHFVAPDLCESRYPDEMTEETVRSHDVAKYFVTSSLGQRKILAGHAKARWLASWLR